MDLFGYLHIDDLSPILDENNIYVPRLRGISLMKYEEPVSQERINSAILRVWSWECAHPYRICCFPYNKKNRYFIYSRDEDGYKEISGINWRMIHGKKRKRARFELKKAIRKVTNFFNVHSKYCGRDDVIRIHARIGGNNWVWCEGPELVAKQPWFLEKVDDYFDCTYCDIYAKIGVINEDIG